MPNSDTFNTYKGVFKPVIDMSVALIIFILFLPVFLSIVLLLFIFNSRMVFFLQPRPGKNNQVFKIIKFKTMNDRRDLNGNLLSDAERLTIIGKFIRKTSLDEMPQLLNVIKGDMSLIGPRPLLIEYLPLYTKEQSRRHEVRPGITGWAQVNGRNAITWQQKFEYDIWYVNNINFILDLKILWLTIKNVLNSKGINADGHATIEKFSGG